MATLLLHSITPDELYAKLREIIREELKQDQLLTLECALKNDRRKQGHVHESD